MLSLLIVLNDSLVILADNVEMKKKNVMLMLYLSLIARYIT